METHRYHRSIYDLTEVGRMAMSTAGGLVALMMRGSVLLGESGRVWSTAKGGYVWNPIEYNTIRRRAARAAACGCPGRDI